MSATTPPVRPVTTPPTADVSRRTALRTALTALLAVLLLVYALWGLDWRDVARMLAGARPAGLLLAALMGVGSLLLRSLRWRLLLCSERAVGMGAALGASAAGQLGNTVLPARAGELVRIVMMSQRSGLDTTFVLTTVVTERIADAIALVLVACVVVLTVPLDLGWIARAVVPLAIVGLAVALLIAAAPWVEPHAASVMRHVPLPARARSAFQAAMSQTLRAFRALHNPTRLFGFLGLTVAIWTMDVLSTVVGGAALGLDIPVPAALLLIATLGVASALPSTPGYAGIFQFAAVTSLGPFGISRTNAIAYILVAQAVMLIVTALFGAAGVIEYLRPRRVRASTDVRPAA